MIRPAINCVIKIASAMLNRGDREGERDISYFFFCSGIRSPVWSWTPLLLRNLYCPSWCFATAGGGGVGILSDEQESSLLSVTKRQTEQTQFRCRLPEKNVLAKLPRVPSPRFFPHRHLVLPCDRYYGIVKADGWMMERWRDGRLS